MVVEVVGVGCVTVTVTATVAYANNTSTRPPEPLFDITNAPTGDLGFNAGLNEVSRPRDLPAHTRPLSAVRRA